MVFVWSSAAHRRHAHPLAIAHHHASKEAPGVLTRSPRLHAGTAMASVHARVVLLAIAVVYGSIVRAEISLAPGLESTDRDLEFGLTDKVCSALYFTMEGDPRTHQQLKCRLNPLHRHHLLLHYHRKTSSTPTLTTTTTTTTRLATRHQELAHPLSRRGGQRRQWRVACGAHE